MLYLYFYSFCHVIVTKFTNPSTTWLKGIWAGVPWDFSRLYGLEMVYPKEVKRRVSKHQPTKHDNLKIPKMSDSTK